MSAPIADQYKLRSAQYDKYTLWVHDEEMIFEVEQKLLELPVDGIVVDLCAGTGFLSRNTQLHHAYTWIDIDISIDMLKANPKPQLQVNADAHLMPLRDHCVDLVLIRSAYDYMDHFILLKQISRIMKDGSALLIMQKVNDCYGRNSTWLDQIQKLRNPLKRNSISSLQVCEELRNAHFVLTKGMLLHRRYRYKLNEWISRQGTINENDQKRIEQLLISTPVSLLNELNIILTADYIEYPIDWFVFSATR